MNFKDLLDYDSSLVLEYPDTWHERVDGPVAIDDFRPDHFLFIKNKKFLNKLISKVESDEKFASCLKTMGIVTARTFFKEMDLDSNSNPWKMVMDKIGFVVSSDNIDLTMSYLSKPYYDIKVGCPENNIKDGRQSGNVEIHSSASIADNVFLGDGVHIGKGVVIHSGCNIMKGCRVGDNSVLYSNVTLYNFVNIGNGCRIHSGTVIGADGFGYNFDQGVHLKVWHFGGVVIGNDVEIGAHASIDTGTFSPTRIGDGTKIDNQVQIGHNCQIGLGVILCGHVGVAGSTKIGDFCVVGGSAGIGNDLTIGDRCQVAGFAGVNCDWPDDSIVGGHPARPVSEWLRGVAYIRKSSLKKGKK